MKPFAPFIALTVAAGVVLTGCAAAPIIDHSLAQAKVKAAGFTDEDIAQIEGGQYTPLIVRLKAKGYPNLTPIQLKFLCNSLIRADVGEEAELCLDQAVKAGAMTAETVREKRALILLQRGEYELAESLSAGVKTRSAQYIHALAAVAIEDSNGVASGPGRAEALKLAKQWQSDPEPTWAYLSANLFIAAKDYRAAEDMLFHSEALLSERYSLVPKKTMGMKAEVEPFRLDPFDEFRFGVTEISVIAPGANALVDISIAKVLIAKQDYAGAEKHLAAVSSAPDTANQLNLSWMVYALLGDTKAKQGRTDEGLAYYKRSADVIERLRGSIGSEGGRIGFLRDKQYVYRAVVDYSLKAGLTDQAIDYSERGKSRALADLVNSRSKVIFNSQPQVATVVASLSENEAYARMAMGDGNSAEVIRYQDSATKEKQTLQALSPKVSGLISPAPVTVASVRADLKPNEAVLLYSRTNDGYALFFVSKARVKQYPLNSTAVEAGTSEFIDLFSDIGQKNATDDGATIKTVLTRGADVSSRLYDSLIAPAAADIKGMDLIIVPTGDLFYVPFGGLKGPDGYLIETHAVAVIPNLTILRSLKAQGKARKARSLVLGDPTLAFANAVALPNAKAEATDVAGILKTTPLLNAAASEASFKQQAPGTDLIHLAAHATYNSKVPLESAVLLAASGSEDGLLTAEELYGVQLNAYLVVLSACETARSKVMTGDEVMGLIRGFMFAGADNIIGSLWQVEDTSTRELMGYFYQELARGATPAAALRVAQRKMIKTKKSNMFFWAAFQTYGGL